MYIYGMKQPETFHPVERWMSTADQAARELGKHRNTILHAWKIGLLRGYRSPDAPKVGRGSTVYFDPVDYRSLWPLALTHNHGERRRKKWYGDSPIDWRAIDEFHQWSNAANAEDEQEAAK